MRNRDWSHIEELCKELAPEANSWRELAEAISSRIGRMPRSTLKEGIERRLGRPVSLTDLRVWASGVDESEISPLCTALLNYLRVAERRDTPFSLLDLCDRFDRSPNSIQAAITDLHNEGYLVEVTDDQRIIMPRTMRPTVERLPVELWTKPAQIHRYGVLSDTHLANRCARLDVLEALYDIYQSEGIETVLHGGNMIDGEFKFNRYELLAHGVEGQIQYAVKNYPQRDGIVTKFITADCHEGWWAKDIGLDIGRYMESRFVEAEREDLVWIGHVERDLSLSDDNPQALLRIMHPGGGTAYADSYAAQKHIESWQGGQKPSVAIFGHFHKMGLFYPREVWTLLAGCVEDQTMFMRKKKLAAHVCGWILEIHLTAMGGVARVKAESFPFYDAGYYQQWDYSSMFD